MISNGPFIRALLSFELLQHLEFVESCGAFEFRVMVCVCVWGGIFSPSRETVFFFLPCNVKHHLKSDRRWFRDYISSYFREGKKEKFEHVFCQLPTITEVALQTRQDVKCLQLRSHFSVRRFHNQTWL